MRQRNRRIGDRVYAYSIAFLLLVTIACFSGCSCDVAYRIPPATSGATEQCPADCSDKNENKNDACEPKCSTQNSSVEERSYHTKDHSFKGSYLLGFVEFDDQGWFHNLSQRKALFDALSEQRSKDKELQFLIVTYAHGWKHNAKATDDDVVNFSHLLERLDAVEQLLVKQKNAANQELGLKPRKVVGVYLGWRGESLKIPLLKELTFWTRKNAGERVGDRSAKQLLMELNELRVSLNGWNRSDCLANAQESQLILIGHSFGGLLMYHALHTELMDRATQIRLTENRQQYEYGTAKSFGDFILLVNPAFEGAAYEPLFRAAESRRFSDRQRPVIAIVTSKTDWATKYAFPIGRLYTLFQSAPHDGERAAVMKTVGHLQRYITDGISYEEKAGGVEKTKGVAPVTQQQAEQVTAEVSQGPKKSETTEETVYDGVRVHPTGRCSSDFPYIVMSAEDNVIDGHSDIWNERFARFMISFISKEIMDQPPKGHCQSVKNVPPFSFPTSPVCK